MQTGIIYHSRYLDHETGYHPENKERLLVIDRHLNDTGLYQRLVRIAPRMAGREEILLAHSSNYVDTVAQACLMGEQMLNLDTPICRDSYSVALLAAGGVLAGIDAIMDGKVAHAFAMVRPPGHHAPRDRSLGFCLFNNIAIGAKYLKERYFLERILIVDWDIHHGNGTQDIFYQEEGIFYLSLHQQNHYPFTGYGEEQGEGEGRGWTLNLPLPGGIYRERYREAFSSGLKKALQIKPQFILVSAGFDAHEADPLGFFPLQAQDFYWMTRELVEKGGAFSNGRILSALEGGYEQKALALSVEAHLKGYLE